MTSQADEIGRTVSACARYWRRTRVPRTSVGEMRSELEQHLHEAIAEGKSVASVVGPDVTAFAEAWAREYRPPLVRPRPWPGLGPAVLAFLVGISMVFYSFAIPTRVVAESQVCCPPRIVDRTVESVPWGQALFWIAIGVAALTIVAGILLLLSRFSWASGVLVLAAIGAFNPATYPASVLLLVTLIWSLWILRRGRHSPVSARSP